MKNAVEAFILAFRFLTVIPLPLRANPSPIVFGRAVTYFPLVGAIVGGILVLFTQGLLRLFPPAMSAALLMGFWIGGTGALHLDGLLDACDGLFGGKTPEQRLQIMRDERIGAFAFAGGMTLLISQYAALASLLQHPAPSWYPALLLSPLLGRQAMAWAIVLFPYARPDGLGKAMKTHASPYTVGVTTLLTAMTAWSVAGVRGLSIALGTLLFTLGLGRWFTTRVGGLTGDLYGALGFAVEVVVLVAFTAQTP